jgi:toxin YoeB
MELSWTHNAWEDYVYWQTEDKKILTRINALIKDTLRNPHQGIGKPEPLKGNFSGCWSRRINDEHRIVYMIQDKRLIILQCRFHYS